MELGPAGTAEVAQLGVIDAEAIVEVVNQFRYQDAHVGIALAMGMGGHVDRHALDPSLEIGAVIEVESPDEVLVRLAVTRVLGDDQTRDGLEQLAFAGDRPKPEIGRTDSPLGCAGGDADEIVVAAGDDQGVQRLRLILGRERAAVPDSESENQDRTQQCHGVLEEVGRHPERSARDDGHNDQLGSRTLSTTWMTPFDWITS